MPRCQSTVYDVVIAGAGPVGLFLACELRLAGCSVLVLETAEAPRSPLKAVPFGLRGLSVPSAESFDRRGLLDAIQEHAAKAARTRPRTGRVASAVRAAISPASRSSTTRSTPRAGPTGDPSRSARWRWRWRRSRPSWQPARPSWASRSDVAAASKLSTRRTTASSCGERPAAFVGAGSSAATAPAAPCARWPASASPAPIPSSPAIRPGSSWPIPTGSSPAVTIP